MINSKARRLIPLVVSVLFLASCASVTSSTDGSGASSTKTTTSSPATTTSSTATTTSGTSGDGTIVGTYSESASQSVTYTSTNAGAGTATETLSGRYVITGSCTVTGGTWTSTTANQAY